MTDQASRPAPSLDELWQGLRRWFPDLIPMDPAATDTFRHDLNAYIDARICIILSKSSWNGAFLVEIGSIDWPEPRAGSWTNPFWQNAPEAGSARKRGVVVPLGAVSGEGAWHWECPKCGVRVDESVSLTGKRDWRWFPRTAKWGHLHENEGVGGAVKWVIGTRHPGEVPVDNLGKADPPPPPEPLHPVNDCRRWQCPECKERVNPGLGRWRFYGSDWQHYHDYPIGHVVAVITPPEEECPRGPAGLNPLPRCAHGRPLLDGAGEILKLPCGCRWRPLPGRVTEAEEQEYWKRGGDNLADDDE